MKTTEKIVEALLTLNDSARDGLMQLLGALAREEEKKTIRVKRKLPPLP